MDTLSAFAKIRGGLLALTLALLAGCAFTTGAGTGSVRYSAATDRAYEVCGGVHASRLPGRERVGQVCQVATSLKFVQ